MLVKSERIEGTPFLAIWEKDLGWSFGIGNYRMSEYHKTKEELIAIINKKDWETISGMIAAMINATLKLHNLI